MIRRRLLVLMGIFGSALLRGAVALSVLAAPGAAAVLAPAEGNGSGSSSSSSSSAEEDLIRAGTEGNATAHVTGDCLVCHLLAKDAPLLYAQERKDGMGCVLTSIIYHMAYAAWVGLNFGGVYDSHSGTYHRHGIDIAKVTSDFFSLRSQDQVFEPDIDWVKGLNSTRIVPHIAFLQEAVIAARPGVHRFVLESAGLGARSIWTVRPFTPSFLDLLREQTQPFLDRRLARRSFFSKTTSKASVNVAMHVRRGDVLNQTNLRRSDWYTPNKWYDKVVEHIHAVSQNASIHIFSESSETHKHQFDDFQRRGMALHLDGDVMDAWAHFATADIFVMAKSSFSEVPALLNKNCVIFNNWGGNPRPHLPGWFSVGDDPAPGLRAGLRACLREKLRGAHVAE